MSPQQTRARGTFATSHWTVDGRFHTGPLEACANCDARPDDREPQARTAGR